MLKRYTFWFSAAVIFQFLTAAIHALSLFIPLQPTDDTERRMVELVTTYKMDMGAGFHPTFFNLFTALSSSFTFLCLFAALTNGYLLWKHTEANVMKGIIGINLAVFGIFFVVAAYFTFLPPIICVGLIFINLLAAFVVAPKTESDS